MRAALAAAALAVVLGAAQPAGAEPRDARLREVRSFALALGTQRDLPRRLAGVDLVVVDGEDTPARDVRRLRAGGGMVLGYLSVGTIERHRSWYGRARRYRLERWDHWGEWYADVSRPGFRALIAGEVAPRLLRKGFDGLFLDNTDMIEAHPRQRRGMRRLAGALSRRLRGRGGLLFTQNGEGSIGPSLGLYDGWNREDVSSTYDFARRRYARVGPAQRRAAVRALRRIGSKGLLVTATDYVARGDDRTASAAVRTACAAGALPFVADIRLARLRHARRTCS